MHGGNSAALEADGQKDYVCGSKPGFYPLFAGSYPLPVPLNLSDPFGLNQDMDEALQDTALLAEVTNGRLAMLGLMVRAAL